MKKPILFQIQFILVTTLIVVAGCDEDLSSKVGRVCDPAANFDESDYEDLNGTLFNLDDESGQCAVDGTSSPCVLFAEPFDDTSLGFVYDHFCSCRCEDADGHDHNDNDSLCKCPGDTECVHIMPEVDGVSQSIVGAYCVPRCLMQGDCPGDCEAPGGDGSNWDWDCGGE